MAPKRQVQMKSTRSQVLRDLKREQRDLWKNLGCGQGMHKINNELVSDHRRVSSLVPIVSPRMTMRHATLIGNMQGKECFVSWFKEDSVTFLINDRVFPRMFPPGKPNHIQSMHTNFLLIVWTISTKNCGWRNKKKWLITLFKKEPGLQDLPHLIGFMSNSPTRHCRVRKGRSGMEDSHAIH
jgi:hypothetical protein